MPMFKKKESYLTFEIVSSEKGRCRQWSWWFKIGLWPWWLSCE